MTQARGLTPWRQHASPPGKPSARPHLSLSLLLPAGLSLISIAVAMQAFAGYVHGLMGLSADQDHSRLSAVADEPRSQQSPRSGQSRPRPVVEGALEDPTGTALAPFFRKLSQLQSPGQDPTATIIQFGDSHTAADFFTGQVRRRLQRVFGDAGRGLLYPGRAFKYYIQRDVKHGSSGPWTVQLGLRADAHEPLGLGGVRMTASSPEASLYLETCSGCYSGTSVSAFEVAYWQRPGGGPLQVLIDGQPDRVIDTSGKELFGRPTLPVPPRLPPSAPQFPQEVLLDTWLTNLGAEGISGGTSGPPEGSTGYARVEVPPGSHKLELRPTGDGPVDLFTVGMESPGPGVRLDALGINGAWIGNPARWQWHLASDQLRRRNPALVTFWYGTNESTMNPFDALSYEQLWLSVVQRVRDAVPESACLLIGPADRVVRNRKDCRPRRDRRGRALPLPAGCEWRPLNSIRTITEIERGVARKTGCAFWDVQSWMGGPGSLERWVQASPPLAQADRVHLTRDGYERLGDTLADLLLEAYNQYGAEAELGERLPIKSGKLPGLGQPAMPLEP